MQSAMRAASAAGPGQTQAAEALEVPLRRLELSHAERLHVWAHPQCVWQCDRDRRLTWVSDGVTTLAGWDRDELVGHSYIEYFNHEHHLTPDWRDEIRVAIYAGDSAYFETDMLDSTGSTVQVAGYVNPHFALDGSVDGFRVGMSRRDHVRSVVTRASAAVDLLESCLRAALDAHTTQEITRFIGALESGGHANLLISAPGADGLPAAYYFEQEPSVDVLAHILHQAVGQRGGDLPGMRRAAEALTNGGAVVMKVPSDGDQPAKVRTYCHTARIVVEDRA